EMCHTEHEVEWGEIRVRAEELLALSEDEGDRLLESMIAGNNFQTVADICESLRFSAHDSGLPVEDGAIAPTLIHIRAINEKTGREVLLVLRPDQMFIFPTKEKRAEI
ncbi:MAG: hypothetical protein PHO54_03450, partial [Candidatus Peribacteraceae bacterium]|nr:hypothetical protein [Candidatus Peribacteraceae bacterium]